METTQFAGQPVPSITYKQDELSQIVSVLCHCTEPEEIILFGSLAEGTTSAATSNSNFRPAFARFHLSTCTFALRRM